MKATAIIMAGGDSTRMGRDKSMLPIDGRSIIKHIVDQLTAHFDQILISSNDVVKYGFLGLEVIPDKVAGRGPLMGIASALGASANEVNFVIACDIPHVDIALMKTMLREAHNHDAVVPVTGPARYEPLFAVYKKSMLAAITESLASGNNRIIDPFARCNIKYIDLSTAPLQWLKNINTIDDYWELVRTKSNVAV